MESASPGRHKPDSFEYFAGGDDFMILWKESFGMG